MKTQIEKWGHSLAIQIPQALALQAHLEAGAAVELSLVDGKLIVSPIARVEVALEQLLARVTAENIHGEIDTGPAMGNEGW